MVNVSFTPESARSGELPPREQAKAVASQAMIADIAEHLGTSVSELLGGCVLEPIASTLQLKGGGRVTPRALRKVLARCRAPDLHHFPETCT